MFIEQGIRREPAAERQALLNSLLIGASQRPTTHRQSLISAIICTLPHIVWAYDAAHNRELMSFTGEAKGICFGGILSTDADVAVRSTVDSGRI